MDQDQRPPFIGEAIEIRMVSMGGKDVWLPATCGGNFPDVVGVTADGTRYALRRDQWRFAERPE